MRLLRAPRRTRSTCRRSRPAAGRCTSTPATRARRCRWCATTSRAFAGYDAVVAPSGSCTGVGAPPARAAWRARRRRGAAERARASWRRAPTSCREFLVDVLGVTDVGAYYPHRVTYHPTCHSLRLLRVGDRPLRLLREVRGPRARRPARGRVVLRVRRHVRAEERRGVRGHARRQDDRRRSHRRARSARPATRRACCTSAAGCRGQRPTRAVHLARSWPRRVSTRGEPDVTFLGMPTAPRRCRPTCAPSSPSRPRPTTALRRRAAAPQPRPGHDDDPRQAGRRRGRAARLGAAARGRRGDQGRRARPPRALPRAARGSRSRARGGTVHWARDANEANAIVTGLVRAAGRRRGGQGQVDGHAGDRAERGPGRRGHRRVGDRPRRAHRAARPRPPEPHPRPRHPPQPRRDPRHLPARDARRRPAI